MTKQVFPEIRFRFSRQFYNGVSKPLFEQQSALDPRARLLTPEETLETTHAYEATWKPLEQKIIAGMCQVFELDFYLPVVDVFIAPRVSSFSTPLIINTREEPDGFVDILTHELLHVLLSDNRQKIDMSRIKNHLYPNEPEKVQNHIFVHAGHKYIYLDVLNDPARLQRDQTAALNNPPYKRAWEIVDQEGYKEIIEKLKSSY